MSNRLNRKASVQLLQQIQDLEVATVEQGRVIDSLRGQVDTWKDLYEQASAELVAALKQRDDRDAIISALTSTNDKLQAEVDALTKELDPASRRLHDQIAAANEAVKPLPILEPATIADDCSTGGCACASLPGGSQLLDPPLKDGCADV